MKKKAALRVDLDRLDDIVKYLDQSTVKDFLASMYSLFESTGASAMIKMKNGLESKNGMDIAFAAHSFVSSCGTVGANMLLELCVSLEEAGKNGKYDAAASLYSEVVEEFSKAKSELKVVMEMLLRDRAC